jgi:hypothetical protein
MRGRVSRRRIKEGSVAVEAAIQQPEFPLLRLTIDFDLDLNFSHTLLFIYSFLSVFLQIWYLLKLQLVRLEPCLSNLPRYPVQPRVASAG